MNFQAMNASASPEVSQNENWETIDYLSIYGKRQPVTTLLTWGYYGGIWGGNTIAAGTLTLTNTSTNYVVVLRSTGAISTSTSATNWNDTGAYARVYKLTTAGGVVTVTEDHRAGPYGTFFAAPAVGDITGLGAGIATFLATPSSANFAAAVTGETGTGALVFGTSPTFTTSVIGGASFDVFNTASTTINAFGAATTATLGATTGTMTLRNATVAVTNALTVGTTLNITGTSTLAAVNASGLFTRGANSSGNPGLQIGPTTTGFYEGIFGAAITSYTLGNSAFNVNTSGAAVSVNAITGGNIYQSINNVPVTQANAAGLAVTGALSATTTIRPGGFTVATLPAGTAGMKAYVTDALAPAFLVLLASGGAAYSGAQYDGSQWVGD